jgi:hypothetical protein
MSRRRWPSRRQPAGHVVPEPEHPGRRRQGRARRRGGRRRIGRFVRLGRVLLSARRRTRPGRMPAPSAPGLLPSRRDCATGTRPGGAQSPPPLSREGVARAGPGQNVHVSYLAPCAAGRAQGAVSPQGSGFEPDAYHEAFGTPFSRRWFRVECLTGPALWVQSVETRKPAVIKPHPSQRTDGRRYLSARTDEAQHGAMTCTRTPNADAVKLRLLLSW